MVNSSLFIVTGASHGFGRALSLTLSQHLLSPETFLLFGRDQAALQDLENEIFSLRSNLQTKCCLFLADLDTLEGLMVVVNAIKNEDFEEYDRIIFFTNAGTLGPLGPIESLPSSSSSSLSDVLNCVQLNMTSPCILITEFVQHYKATLNCHARATIVNISSLWAIEPAPTFAWYSSTKSAVKMFMEVAAEENKNYPLLRFLNYAPGPLEGRMQQIIREDPSIDTNIRVSCHSLLARGQLVPPHVSAKKCIRLAIEECYRSGDHVDFYDQIDGIDTERPTPTTCCGNPNCQCGPACTCKQYGAQCGACQSFLLGNRSP